MSDSNGIHQSYREELEKFCHEIDSSTTEPTKKDATSLGTDSERSSVASSTNPIRYSPDEILALKDTLVSTLKPNCVDEKGFWVGNKQQTPLRNFNRNLSRRVGSGRLPSDEFQGTFREKTGREFCEDFASRTNRPRSTKDFRPTYFNPVNKDHRRVLEGKRESEPEWFKNGPSSRFDTVELGGFDDSSDHQTLKSLPSTNPFKWQPPSQQRPSPKYNNPFLFDEFSRQEGYFAQPKQNQRPKPTFKRETFVAPHREKENSHNGHGNALLDLLHGHMQLPTGNASHSAYSNLSQMPSVSELESSITQTNQLLNQLNNNKQYLASKAMMDVLNVISYTQQQQQARQQAPQLNEQVMRMFELHRQIQAANPVLGLQANTPQFWENIHQRQKAYYEQYERQQFYQQMTAPAGHKSNNNKKGNRVHFSPQTEQERINQFFNPNLVRQASNSNLAQLDPDKALKVEEFERKIKEAASSCKRN